MTDAWLPELLPWEGDAERRIPAPAYQALVYAAYVRDFIAGEPKFRGIRVARIPEPTRDGMCNTFWKITTETEANGSSRVIAPRRYERIQWVRAMIDAAEDVTRVAVYPVEHQHGVTRYEIALLEDFSHIVVLEARADRFVLWSNFPQETGKRQRKARKKHEKWLESQKKLKPPSR